MKITKTITDRSGEKQAAEKMIELVVKPGWKEGKWRKGFCSNEPLAMIACYY